MELTLERFAYSPTETEGRLRAGQDTFFTMERPWLPYPAAGGRPFESCIPDGTYELRRHLRPSGEMAICVVNPDLGVWHYPQDRPSDAGRYLILIHTANYVDDLAGCIGPGLTRAIFGGRRMVTSSRVSMRNLLRLWDADPEAVHTLVIKPAPGAKDLT